MAGEALDLVALSSAEVSANERIVLLVVARIQLLLVVVLELIVALCEAVGELLGAAHKPETANLQLGLFTEDTHTTESVLAGVLGSGKEATEQVRDIVELLTLAFQDIVLEMPEAPAFPIEHLVELVHSLTLLVLVVDEEGLEVVQVE